eukprot:746064-Hanusia_phi.AAC.1
MSRAVSHGRSQPRPSDSDRLSGLRCQCRAARPRGLREFGPEHAGRDVNRVGRGNAGKRNEWRRQKFKLPGSFQVSRLFFNPRAPGPHQQPGRRSLSEAAMPDSESRTGTARPRRETVRGLGRCQEFNAMTVWFRVCQAGCKRPGFGKRSQCESKSLKADGGTHQLRTAATRSNQFGTCKLDFLLE